MSSVSSQTEQKQETTQAVSSTNSRDTDCPSAPVTRGEAAPAVLDQAPCPPLSSKVQLPENPTPRDEDEKSLSSAGEGDTINSDENDEEMPKQTRLRSSDVDVLYDHMTSNEITVVPPAFDGAAIFNSPVPATSNGPLVEDEKKVEEEPTAPTNEPRAPNAKTQIPELELKLSASSSSPKEENKDESWVELGSKPKKPQRSISPTPDAMSTPLPASRQDSMTKPGEGETQQEYLLKKTMSEILAEQARAQTYAKTMAKLVEDVADIEAEDCAEQLVELIKPQNRRDFIEALHDLARRIVQQPPKPVMGRRSMDELRALGIARGVALANLVIELEAVLAEKDWDLLFDDVYNHAFDEFNFERQRVHVHVASMVGELYRQGFLVDEAIHDFTKALLKFKKRTYVTAASVMLDIAAHTWDLKERLVFANNAYDELKLQARRMGKPTYMAVKKLAERTRPAWMERENANRRGGHGQQPKQQQRRSPEQGFSREDVVSESSASMDKRSARSKAWAEKHQKSKKTPVKKQTKKTRSSPAPASPPGLPFPPTPATASMEMLALPEDDCAPPGMARGNSALDPNASSFHGMEPMDMTRAASREQGKRLINALGYLSPTWTPTSIMKSSPPPSVELVPSRPTRPPMMNDGLAPPTDFLERTKTIAVGAPHLVLAPMAAIDGSESEPSLVDEAPSQQPMMLVEDGLAPPTDFLERTKSRVVGAPLQTSFRYEPDYECARGRGGSSTTLLMERDCSTDRTSIAGSVAGRNSEMMRPGNANKAKTAKKAKKANDEKKETGSPKKKGQSAWQAVRRREQRRKRVAAMRRMRK